MPYPLFADGSLLEGSRQREETAYVRDEGDGLLRTTMFAGRPWSRR